MDRSWKLEGEQVTDFGRSVRHLARYCVVVDVVLSDSFRDGSRLTRGHRKAPALRLASSYF